MGIECDVQQSSDGRAVVFHDWDLSRLTGEDGFVACRTAAELSQLRLGGGSERIPILRDSLAMVHGRVPLLIEIKTKRERGISALCLAVLHDLDRYRGEVAVMSFDPRVPAWFRGNAPRLVRGLVTTEEGAHGFSAAVRRRCALWHARPDFIAYDVRNLPSGFAAAQRRRGLPVLTWTVRDAAQRRRAEEYADSPIAESEGIAESVASS